MFQAVPLNQFPTFSNVQIHYHVNSVVLFAFDVENCRKVKTIDENSTGTPATVILFIILKLPSVPT
jgi:hypothetical protein